MQYEQQTEGCPKEGRWLRRQFIDGFNSVRGLIQHAKRFPVEAPDERWIELANEHELHVDHWIELVGIGVGTYETYQIGDERVTFIKHTNEFMSDFPGGMQVEMQRDNRVAPQLVFPCTPAELIEFIDTAIGIHCFMVPDAFRLAVVQQTTPPVLSQISEPPNLALVESSYQANKYQADWPLCTKQEIIDGFQLTGKNWSDFLSRPNKYKEAVKQLGRKGVGGDALLSPIIFARLLVTFEDLTEGQVKARFLKVDEWKQWEAEMIAEIGEI